MSRFSASFRPDPLRRASTPHRSLGLKSTAPAATREIVATFALVAFLLSQSVLPCAFTLQSAQAAPRAASRGITSTAASKTAADSKTAAAPRAAVAAGSPAPQWYETSRRQEAQRRRDIKRGMKLLLAQAPAANPALATGVTSAGVTIEGLPEAGALGALGASRPTRRNLPGNIKPSAPLYVPNAFTTLKTLDLSGERVPTQKEVSGQGGACGALAPAAPAEPAAFEAEIDGQLRGEGFEQGLRTAMPASERQGLPPGVRALARRLETAKERVKAAKAANREFALTMLDWNAGRFKKAVRDMEAYNKKHPKSPWVPEALIHLADYAKFTAQPNKAQELYQQVMELTSATPDQMSFEAHQKAYERWADLYLMEGRLSEARPMLEDIAQNDRHWRRRTWATYWLHQLNILQNDPQALLAMRDCGVRALAMVFNELGQNGAARRVAALRPPSEAGFSLAELRGIAARQGLEVKGFRARPAQLAALPLPLILHYAPSQGKAAFAKGRGTLGQTLPVGGVLPRRVPSGGHFMIVRALDARRGTASLLNPQDGSRSTLTLKQLGREWSGAGLMLAGRQAASRLAGEGAKVRWLAAAPTPKSSGPSRVKTAPKAASQSKGRVVLLSEAEMRRVRGTCYAVGAAGGTGVQDSNAQVCSVCPPPEDPDTPPHPNDHGSPAVDVNRLTQNVFIHDTPLWYQPAKGPGIALTLSYNSQAASDYNPSFGNKWSFNYGSHIAEVPSTQGDPGRVTLFCPDGKQLLFFDDGAGGYKSQRGVFDTLSKTGPKTFTLVSQGGDKTFFGLPNGTSAQDPLLLRQEDRFGQGLDFGYAVQNGKIVLAGITDAVGQTTGFAYDGSGHILTVMDPFQRSASFSYDDNGNLVECVDMEGNAFQYTYDDAVNVTQLNTAQGPWVFTYLEHQNSPDGHEDSVTITNPLEQKQKFAWVGHNSQYVDPKGNVTPIHGTPLPGAQLTVNPNNSVADTGVAISSMTSPTGETTSYTYASNDGSNAGKTLEPTSITDARGHVTSYAYNAQGRLTSSRTDAGGSFVATSTSYAANGLDVTGATVSGQKADGMVQSRVVLQGATYDARHLPLSVTDAEGRTSSFTYTAWGAPQSVTDPLGQTTYSYNSAFRVASVSRDGIVQGSATYDAVGRVKTATDMTGVTLTYAYNNLDLVTKVTYPDGTTEETDYACCALPGVVKDRAGRRSYYDYDGLKQLVRVQDASGNTLQMDYDAEGNMVRLLDAKGHSTRWSYDASGRALKKTYHDGKSEETSYDRGAVSATRDARGRVVNYLYDEMDNLSRVDFPNMADISYSYDALGQVTSVRDGVGTHGFTYSGVGRLTALDGPFAGDGQSFVYDSVGRLSSQSVARGASGGAQTQSYTFDALQRLQTLTSSGTQGAGVFTYNYAGNTGMLARLDLPNGAKTEQSYDALHRLTQVQNVGAGGANLASYAYGYDNRDVRTGVTSQLGADPLKQIAYGYDAVDQLTGESATGGVGGSAYSNAFSYDSMGNRKRVENVSGGNSSVTRSTPNELNQITALSTSQNGAPGQNSGFTYDAGGNLTQVIGSDGSKTLYTYDDADRLTRIENRNSANTPTSKSEFVYDYASRKAISREFNYQNSAWVKTGETRRVFDGLDVVQERNAANEVTAQYTRDGNIGGILARASASGKSYFHYDGGGNVTALSDETGNLVGRYSYDAFGNTLEVSGARAQENPYRFSTKELHFASGMVDFGFRFYSPGMGRWLNRDPIRESGGVNVYAMVRNNPVNGLDDYGLLIGDADFISVSGGFGVGAQVTYDRFGNLYFTVNGGEQQGFALSEGFMVGGNSDQNIFDHLTGWGIGAAVITPRSWGTGVNVAAGDGSTSATASAGSPGVSVTSGFTWHIRGPGPRPHSPGVPTPPRPTDTPPSVPSLPAPSGPNTAYVITNNCGGSHYINLDTGETWGYRPQDAAPWLPCARPRRGRRR